MTQINDYRKGLLLRLLVALVFAGYPTIASLSLSAKVTIVDIMLVRFGVGAVMFGPYLATKFLALPRRCLLAGLALAVFHGIGMTAVALLGLQYAPASHQALLGPPLVSLWAIVAGRIVFGQKVTHYQAFGMLFVAFGAAIIFVSQAGATLDSTVLFGDALFVTAGAMGGFSAALLFRLKLDPYLSTAMVTVFSFLLLLPAVEIESTGLTGIPVGQLIGLVLYLGVICGGFVVYAVHLSVKLIGPQRASAFDALVPVLGVVIAVVFAGDALTLPISCACVLVVFGVYLIARWKH